VNTNNRLRTQNTRLIFRVFALLLAAALFVGCALYRQDKMYISDSKYEMARTAYDQTNSLLLTENRLRELNWQRAEINEALYRLKKEYGLE